MAFYSDYVYLVFKIGLSEITVIAALYAIFLIGYLLAMLAKHLSNLIMLSKFWDRFKPAKKETN